MITDPNDACCKIPVCNTPAPTPNPTPNPYPNPTIGPNPTAQPNPNPSVSPTPGPNPNPQPTPAPQPKSELIGLSFTCDLILKLHNSHSDP